MEITPNFHFRGNCKEAIDLYKKVFDIKILTLLENKDANPIDYAFNDTNPSHVYHAEIMIENSRLIMSDISTEEEHRAGNSLSLVVTFDTMDHVKKAYNVLRDEAVILSPMKSTSYSSCFVSLIDKFGMRWELMTEQTEK